MSPYRQTTARPDNTMETVDMGLGIVRVCDDREFYQETLVTMNDDERAAFKSWFDLWRTIHYIKLGAFLIVLSSFGGCAASWYAAIKH